MAVKKEEKEEKQEIEEKKQKPAEEPEAEEEWSEEFYEEDVEEDEDKDKEKKKKLNEEKEKKLAEIDELKLKFTKIKDLKVGMEDVNVIAEIDFLGQKPSFGYGEPKYVPAIVKDETGEIKLTFWEEDADKAKPGKKFKLIKGYVTEYRGQLQLNFSREYKVVWI